MRPERDDIQPRPCHICGGSGTHKGERCRTCRASGKLYLNVGPWWHMRAFKKTHLREVEVYPGYRA